MAWPFLTPVNPNEVSDYYIKIKEPMGNLFICLFVLCLRTLLLYV